MSARQPIIGTDYGPEWRARRARRERWIGYSEVVVVSGFVAIVGWCVARAVWL